MRDQVVVGILNTREIDEQGVWIEWNRYPLVNNTTVGPLAPQLWGYWYLVDGVKALDPSNGETQRDGSRYDNLLMISGPESEFCNS